MYVLSTLMAVCARICAGYNELRISGVERSDLTGKPLTYDVGQKSTATATCIPCNSNMHTNFQSQRLAQAIDIINSKSTTKSCTRSRILYVNLTLHFTNKLQIGNVECYARTFRAAALSCVISLDTFVVFNWLNQM